MKTNRLYLVLLFVFIILYETGCEFTIKQVGSANNETPKILGENTLAEEDKSMSNKNLVTKDELLEFIEINDIGLSKDDFADIDVNEFIDYAWLSKDNLGRVNIKNNLEIYKSTLRGRAFDPYKAKEVFSVCSSDEEYELFKNTFINKIGTDMQYIGHTRENIEMFYIKIDGKRVRIHLGKTRNMDNYEVTATSDGSLCITERDSGDTHRNSPFCYSKNKKYFMILQPSLEIMEAFCEIDDWHAKTPLHMKANPT